MAANEVTPYEVGDIFVDKETGKTVQVMLRPIECEYCFYKDTGCASPALECRGYNRPHGDTIYFKEVQECTE